MSAPAGVSLREFARRDGCSDRLVRNAISAGKLKAFADGTLDPALVGTGWRKTNRNAETRADPSADDAATAEMLGAGQGTLAQADRAKANALALKHLLAARKAAGELVEIAMAEKVLFEEARGVRDAWMNWPARVGPTVAADLGLQVETVVEVLTAHVHAHLAELGDPAANFAGDQAP